jgi:hypothetical protein
MMTMKAEELTGKKKILCHFQASRMASTVPRPASVHMAQAAIM